METTFTVAGAALPLTTRSVSSTDVDLAAFIVTVELGLVSAYASAGAKIPDPRDAALARTFAAQHRDHADVWAGVAGSKTVRRPNPRLLRATLADVAGAATPGGVYGVMQILEDRVAATYQHALERLLSDAHLELAASILPVECQHAVVLGILAGKQLKELIPVNFQTPEDFIDPAVFPITG